MRESRFLWFLLVILAAALVALVARHEQGEIGGLSLEAFASLVVLGSLGLVWGAGLLSRFRGQAGQALTAMAFWLLIVVFLALVYVYRMPLRGAGERIMAELIPGYAITHPGTGPTAEIARSASGVFSVRAAINRSPVFMMVDTGASSVVLTQEAARQVGLRLEGLTYDVPIETANGRTRAAAVRLASLRVGAIEERNVPALVAMPGVLSTSLMGLSFLSRLEGFEVRGDRMILRGAAQ